MMQNLKKLAASLEKEEAIIQRGLDTFVEVGEALLRIKEGKLYKATHGTWNEYVRERWGFSRVQAHRLIAASDVVADIKMLPIGNILPTSESQVRPLAVLPKEQQADAWVAAVKLAPKGEPTAKHVKQVVEDFTVIGNYSPELLSEVRSGNITIPQAKREIVKRQRVDTPELPSEKYRVIYADPPWRYGNSGVIGATDNYGHAQRHYPDMSIQELCGLPIKQLANDNAVLFLWVTSPLLEECFAVINAWGFKYKTSFVWDKVKHNFGHYNSVRHELLLVCTRGSCTPDNLKLFDSVQVIEKTKKHSQKPAEFRDIIDTLYPLGKRIELFAREAADGWEVWGNEPQEV